MAIIDPESICRGWSLNMSGFLFTYTGYLLLRHFISNLNHEISTKVVYLLFLFEVEDDECMLAWHFSKVTKIHIDVPNDFQTELLTLLFVVDWGATDDTIELLHEEAPITTFEHRKTTIIEAISQCFWRFFAKFYRKVLLAFAEVFTLVEDVKVNFCHISLALIWRGEYPF